MGDLGTRITLVSDHTDRIGQHRAGWNTPPFSGKPRIDAIECLYAAAGMHHADDLSIRQFLVHEIHILRPDIIEPGAGCVAHPEEIDGDIGEHVLGGSWHR